MFKAVMRVGDEVKFSGGKVRVVYKGVSCNKADIKRLRGKIEFEWTPETKVEFVHDKEPRRK